MQRPHRPSRKRDIDNPTCRFTGVQLVGSHRIIDGGSTGLDSQEIPVAAAEFHRRMQSDDEELPFGPGYAPVPLYRAALTDDEIGTARDLNGTCREDMSRDQWNGVCQLAVNGWKFRWHFDAPPELASDILCTPYKPFADGELDTDD